MSRGSEGRNRRWAIRCWGLGAVLVVAAVGPLVYCAGWGMGGQEAATLGACVEAHPLQFPATMLVAGVLSVAAGLLFRHRHLEIVREQRAREEYLDRRVEAATAGRTRQRTPDEDGMTGEVGDETPDEIEVDTELGLGGEPETDEEDERRDSETLMDYVDTGEGGRGLRGRSTDDGPSREELDYYVPPGMEGAPQLFVDADAAPHPVDDLSRRIDNPERPYQKLDEALRDAFELVTEHNTGVVVRVRPGMYQSGLEIPSRVAVVNHRMPLERTVDERLDWLRDQEDIDHPDRVTLLTPKEADFGVKMVPGDTQGIFGCVLAGRQGVAQTGLVARDNAALAVVHCAFESFRGGGAEVVDCGEDLPGRRVQFVGCVWRGNSAPDGGGGLTIEESAARIEASIFENNRAPRGGALEVSALNKPLIVERCLMQRNRAIEPEEDVGSRTLDVDQWYETDGIGGAIVVEEGLMKLVDTIVDGNDAAAGGGGVAALSSRIIFESTGKDRGVCRENRAGAGGGLLAVGRPGRPAMIRILQAELIKNRGTAIGGGGGVVGNAVFEGRGVLFEQNRADGDDRAVGGAVAGWRGGAVKLEGGEVIANEARASGGGLALYNGSLKLTGRCAVRDNAALGGAGGGIFAVTGSDVELDRLVGQSGFGLPFKLHVENVRITGNTASGPGGGVRAGNLVEKTAFPLVVDITRPDWIADNESESDRRHCRNVWIEWGGTMKTSDETTGPVELRLE